MTKIEQAISAVRLIQTLQFLSDIQRFAEFIERKQGIIFILQGDNNMKDFILQGDNNMKDIFALEVDLEEIPKMVGALMGLAQLITKSLKVILEGGDADEKSEKLLGVMATEIEHRMALAIGIAVKPCDATERAAGNC